MNENFLASLTQSFFNYSFPSLINPEFFNSILDSIAGNPGTGEGGLINMLLQSLFFPLTSLTQSFQR